MKKSRYADRQVMMVSKQAEASVPISELCLGHGMSSASFYKWHNKYSDMDMAKKALSN